MFLEPKCLSLGLGHTAKQPWNAASHIALPLRLAKATGCKTRFEMRNDGFENRRRGEVVPSEWTFRNPLEVHIQFLKWGLPHSQNHPTLLPQESNFSDSGQHKHRGADTTDLPSPQLLQFISCYAPTGFSLVGVFVFSLIASKPSFRC